MTADVEKGGSIKVTVMGRDGKTTFGQKTISKTVTDQRLRFWRKIKADKIKIRFELNKAKVYSFSFE